MQLSGSTDYMEQVPKRLDSKHPIRGEGLPLGNSGPLCSSYRRERPNLVRKSTYLGEGFCGFESNPHAPRITVGVVLSLSMLCDFSSALLINCNVTNITNVINRSYLLALFSLSETH